MIQNIHPYIVLNIDNNLATLYSLTNLDSDTYDTQTISPENFPLTPPQNRQPSLNSNTTHLPTKPASKSRGSKTPKGPINPHYYQQITRHLNNAPLIIILSRGTGKSNAANHLLNHLHTHAPHILPRIIANQNINHPTTNQIIASARKTFSHHLTQKHNTHAANLTRSQSHTTT